jgi:hypothetical protein
MPVIRTRMLVFFRLAGGPPAEVRPLQKLLQSQAGADAMKFDGVRPATIVIFESRAATREGVRAWAGGNASPMG